MFVSMLRICSVSVTKRFRSILLVNLSLPPIRHRKGAHKGTHGPVPYPYDLVPLREMARKMAKCDLNAPRGPLWRCYGLFDGLIWLLRRREGPSSGVIVSFGGGVMGPFRDIKALLAV